MKIPRQLKVDKVYLETHRDSIIVDQKTLDIAKIFLKTESFLDNEAPINIVTSTEHNKITDVTTGQQFVRELRKAGRLSYIEKNRKEKNIFGITNSHSFRGFTMECYVYIIDGLLL